MAAITAILFLSVLCSCGVSLPSESFCTDLDVYELTNQASPSIGDQLPYCRTQELQCCTSDYLLNKKSSTTYLLRSNLQTDLSNVFNPWRQSYSGLTDSLSEFSDQFVDNYPFPPSLIDKVQPFIDTVKPLLKLQLLPSSSAVNMTYNFTQFATDLAYDLIDHFLQASDISESQKTCLGPIIRGKLNLDALDKVGHSMKQLQMLYQALDRTQVFLNQMNLSSIGYSLSDQCLNSILSQRCQQCQQNIPELCENVCTPLVIGCLSPIQTGLQPQVDALWNITRQLTLLVESHMNRTLRVYQPAVMSPTELPDMAALSFGQCGVNLYELLGFKRRKRYLDTIPLPLSLDVAVQGMLSISGIFHFNGHSLPSYCHHSNRLDCWNGQELDDNGTMTTDTFMKVNIEEQQDNPAYNFNTNLLYQQASSLMNPTEDFLQSPDLIAVLPSSVKTPDIVPIPIPTPTTNSNIANQQTTTIIKPSQTLGPVGATDDSSGSNPIVVCSYCLTLLFSVLSVLLVSLIDI